MFWARMKDIEVISSLPGSPYFFFKKNGPVKHSSDHHQTFKTNIQEGKLRKTRFAQQKLTSSTKEE